MMEILEVVLWIIATPTLLFIGLAWLGFILRIVVRSQIYYGLFKTLTVEGDEFDANW